MAMIKIFSGSEILANALKEQLSTVDIVPVVKNNIQSARLGGFGNTDLAVELFIDDREKERAEPVIESFRMNL